MHLPDDMWQLQELEMFRLAVGHLQQWPPNLTRSGGLPKLAWCSLGRNPAAAPVPPISDSLPRVDIHELVLGDKLGQGASGEVFKGGCTQPVYLVKYHMPFQNCMQRCVYWCL